MVRLHTYGKHRRRRTASKTLTAHIATQGKTTKNLQDYGRKDELNSREEQIADASQGMSVEEIRRLLDMDLGEILMVL